MGDPDDLDYLRVSKDVTTLRERTATVLRAAIFDMHLKPGQRLVEKDLCALTGVSRSSVREAMRKLEAEGLVSETSGRGMQVTPLSVQTAREIYEVRAVLEAAAGHSFAMRAASADVRDLKSALVRLKRTEHGRSNGNYVDALDGVYQVLLRGAKNDTARELIETLKGRIHFLRALTSNVETLERRRETIVLMEHIVVAACTGMAGETAERCRAFVERSAAFADQLLRDRGLATELSES